MRKNGEISSCIVTYNYEQACVNYDYEYNQRNTSSTGVLNVIYIGNITN